MNKVNAKAIEHNVKALADIYWTDEIKEAYQASLENPIELLKSK